MRKPGGTAESVGRVGQGPGAKAPLGSVALFVGLKPHAPSGKNVPSGKGFSTSYKFRSSRARGSGSARGSWVGRAAVLVFAAVTVLFAGSARAQGNYEIQVYGADTVPPKNLMVELHSNFTPEGQKNTIDGVYPTNHQEHETLELTEGINDWSEVGFYVFTSEQDGHGVQWVGDHIRPRVRVPDSWHWPVGVSLSTEVGYQRAVYSPDTWTWELRPIVDKTVGRWYFAVNPALERTWHGPDVNQGIGFSPGAKISYDISNVVSAGFEYYADYGRITSPDTLHNQQQQIFAVTDLNVSPKWEINIGVGVGPTAATDHLIVKGILGRRFDWGRHSPVD